MQCYFNMFENKLISIFSNTIVMHITVGDGLKSILMFNINVLEGHNRTSID